MGVNVFPAGGGGSPIKSIQRGVASSAGNITISAVNTSKTMVRSFSTGSSGTVAARGAIGSQSISANVAAHNVTMNSLATTASIQGMNAGWHGGGGLSGNVPITSFTYSNAYAFVGNPASRAAIPSSAAAWSVSAASIPGNIGSTNITGGTTNLTTSEFGIYLLNSTTITATGACRWEVIEFN